MKTKKIKNQKTTVKTSINSISCGLSNFNLITLAEKSINTPKIIATLINTHNCKIMHSQILELGEDLAFNALIYGRWNEIFKLEKAIYELTKKYSMHIHTKRNNQSMVKYNKLFEQDNDKLQELDSDNNKNLTKTYINYVVHATSLNTSTLFYKLFNFFDKYHIPIQSAIIKTSPDNCNLINLELHLKIATDIHIMTLRESFLNLCDSLNLDTSLEPL